MSHTLRTAIYALMAAVAVTAGILSGGCIKDDIPYPHIQANIQDIVAVGQSQNARIDSTKKTVTLYFPEETDIYNVMIEDYRLTPGAVVKDSVIMANTYIGKDATVNYSILDENITVETGAEVGEAKETAKGIAVIGNGCTVEAGKKIEAGAMISE